MNIATITQQNMLQLSYIVQNMIKFWILILNETF